MSDQVIRVEARMSWALLAMAAVFFMGALLFGMLNPTAHTLSDTANSTSDSAKAETGIDRVMQAWSTWPIWFLGALLLWGFNRAKKESNRGGL